MVLLVQLYLFPACAGMNRNAEVNIADYNTVPRMRGDEPSHSFVVTM